MTYTTDFSGAMNMYTLAVVPCRRLEDFLFLAQLNTNPTTDVYQVQCKRSGETLVLKVGW